MKVTIDKAAADLGTTRKGIERRIEKKHWVEGDQWFIAPDGTRWIDIQGVERWVMQGASSSAIQASRSRSRGMANRKKGHLRGTD